MGIEAVLLAVALLLVVIAQLMTVNLLARLRRRIEKLEQNEKQREKNGGIKWRWVNL